MKRVDFTSTASINDIATALFAAHPDWISVGPDGKNTTQVNICGDGESGWAIVPDDTDEAVILAKVAEVP